MADKLPIRPGSPDWPLAWTTYRRRDSMEDDFRALKESGIGLVSMSGRDVDHIRQALDLARRTGMKYHIGMPDITERAALVAEAGFEPTPALMIGGVYQGKAVDRHLFSFRPGRHRIVIEPPVYSKDFPYTLGSGSVGDAKLAEPIGHYFPDIAAPVKAEVVVPLAQFDGKQHLKFIPAEIAEAPAGATLDADSVDPKFADVPEARSRKLYQLSFDLTGLDGALLDKVGLAVYWGYAGSKRYWMFGGGESCALADGTRQALRFQVRKTLAPWAEANGGKFPIDVVIAMRYGDECWHVAGHLNGPAVNYPMWDFCPLAVENFQKRSGGLEHPRTWGFPELYGRDAYAIWLYLLHEQCAEIAGIVLDEVAKVALGLLVFRNQTRAGVFKLTNDHDGSGQELLTRNLDMVHLDPYPVSNWGYRGDIPRDMHYCAGLARRYGKPLMPWMQAHSYGSPSFQGMLVHPTPADVDRMAAEHYVHAPDAVMWLGWGNGFTFPDVNPNSWRRAVAFHNRLAANPPAKPVARLAVVRPYDVRAMSSVRDGQIRNPGDWLLQQFLEVWAVLRGQPYDVFELPPAALRQDLAAIEKEIARYNLVVSTQPRKGAWAIGDGLEGSEIDPAQAETIQKDFHRQMIEKGWLTE